MSVNLAFVFCSREESVFGSRAEFPGAAPHGGQPGVSRLPAEGLAEPYLLSAAVATEPQRDNAPSQHGRPPAQCPQGTRRQELCSGGGSD